MPILEVRHVTTYSYRQPVALGEHRMMLRPRESYDQRLLDCTLLIDPEPVNLRWAHDVFGNCVAYARFGGRTRDLRFESRVQLDHTPAHELNFQMEEFAKTYPFTYGAEDMADLLRSIERHSSDPRREVDAWARRFLRRDGSNDTRDLLAEMTNAIRREFAYVAREEKGIQEPVETLRRGNGSCRDFALLMMEAVRSLGLAARFVSGYLHAPNRGGARHTGGGATHAWLQVYLPGAGWVEFDPTNGIVGNRDLIRVAVVRDPGQAIPLSGTWTGFPSDSLGMSVEVNVTDIGEGHMAPEPTNAARRA